jgi:hypothetical protein
MIGRGTNDTDRRLRGGGGNDGGGARKQEETEEEKRTGLRVTLTWKSGEHDWETGAERPSRSQNFSVNGAVA